MILPALLALSSLLAPPVLDEPPAGPTPPKGLGIVAGRVTYDGPIPPPVPNPEAGTRRRPVEVTPGDLGLRDAAAWLDGVPPDTPTPPGLAPADEPIEVDQVNFEFTPRVTTVEAGRPVAFLNSDVANHGVSASGSSVANRFNVTTPPGGRYVHRFAASRQPVPLGCPIHAAMSGWVLAFDHPYHAVSDARGRFTLPPVPPGRYTLTVHHPDGGFRRRVPVEVREGEATRVEISFHEDDLRLPAISTRP